MACAQACPVGCIEMQADAEGFLYPNVDETKCISCNKCERVCPIINDSKKSEDVITAFAAYSKNEELLLKSSSGAIFTEIASLVLKDGGVVFGAAFDEDFMVRHTYVESMEDLYILQSSKYVQSVIGNSFKEAETFLKAGRKVLYTGTGCQIAGLKGYLGKEYDNLFTIDVLCHGAPSSLVWKKYLDSLKRKTGFEKFEHIRFRVKNPSWKDYSFEVTSASGKKYSQLYRDNIYMKLFLRDICLRPSCYSCSFKNMERYSDITLGDCWGIENIMPDFYNEKGVSVVITHSQPGMKMFDNIKSNLVYKEGEVDFYLPKTADSRHSMKVPSNRAKFFKKLSKCDDVQELLKYTEPDALRVIYRKIKKIIKK